METKKLSKSDFRNAPERFSWNEDIGVFTSLVLVPTNRKHDSGYRIMDFVAMRGDEIVCRLSGCSDVLHIDGIGGYGERGTDFRITGNVVPKGWSIDLLPCGYFRLFAANGKGLKCGPALSSFEFYSLS